jgi:hypothetical protein
MTKKNNKFCIQNNFLQTLKKNDVSFTVQYIRDSNVAKLHSVPFQLYNMDYCEEDILCHISVYNVTLDTSYNSILMLYSM